MQYKDLKEMTIKEWDGVPFEAYYTDDDADTFDGLKIRIVGYTRGMWNCEMDTEWKHTYPVEWNKDKVEEALKPKPKRMTNHQLMEWLAKGHGMVKNSIDSVGTYFSVYGKSLDKPCCDEFKVRKWDSEEWIEPTVDLLEGV